MIVVRDKAELRTELGSRHLKLPGSRTGFVPTMGALHDGHRSLMKAARGENDCVVVSLFVNPMQFGPGEDFDRYPRAENRDLEICSEENVDIVFAPSVDMMYPPDPLTTVTVSGLTDILCGQHRPGHFDGVTTVVTKLFNLVMPQNAYFGQKDAQQALVIRKMTADLDFPIRIAILPTIRESDGLAMSSRNVRLSDKARQIAPAIYRALQTAERLVSEGETEIETILEESRKVIAAHPELSIQYLECRDYSTLQPVRILDRPALLATAVFLETVRLIDNVFLHPREIHP